MINNIINFIIINKFLFIFLLFIYIGICLDNRFKTKNKILILFGFILYIIIFILLKGINILLIKDIFWFSLILNSCFIFHTLICDWIYRICVYKNWEYGSFIITRISFSLSLSFILYLLDLITLHKQEYLTKNKYIKKNKVILKLVKQLNYYSLVLFILISWILIYFVNMFINYNMLILGKQNIKIDLKIIIINLTFFISTLFLAIFIFKTPRLYIIWGFLIIYKFYSLIKENKLKFFTNFTYIMEEDVIKNRLILEKTYDKINTKGFTYLFILFINLVHEKLRNIREHPIKNPYKYYKKNIIIMLIIRSYFNRYISIYNCLNIDYINLIINEEIIANFNLNEIQLKELNLKISKIYKKTISKSTIN